MGTMEIPTKETDEIKFVPVGEMKRPPRKQEEVNAEVIIAAIEDAASLLRSGGKEEKIKDDLLLDVERIGLTNSMIDGLKKVINKKKEDGNELAAGMEKLLKFLSDTVFRQYDKKLNKNAKEITN